MSHDPTGHEFYDELPDDPREPLYDDSETEYVPAEEDWDYQDELTEMQRGDGK